jgi:hypothetical protein
VPGRVPGPRAARSAGLVYAARCQMASFAPPERAAAPPPSTSSMRCRRGTILAWNGFGCLPIATVLG